MQRQKWLCVRHRVTLYACDVEIKSLSHLLLLFLFDFHHKYTWTSTVSCFFSRYICIQCLMNAIRNIKINAVNRLPEAYINANVIAFRVFIYAIEYDGWIAKILYTGRGIETRNYIKKYYACCCYYYWCLGCCCCCCFFRTSTERRETSYCNVVLLLCLCKTQQQQQSQISRIFTKFYYIII